MKVAVDTSVLVRAVGVAGGSVVSADPRIKNQAETPWRAAGTADLQGILRLRWISALWRRDQSSLRMTNL